MHATASFLGPRLGVGAKNVLGAGALEHQRRADGAEQDRLWFEIMTDHHLGGVHMADHAAANGARSEISDFAASVARNQRIEVVEYEGAMRRLGLI